MNEESPKRFYRDYPYPTSTGKPDTFILNGMIWVAAQPTSASTISLVSSAAGDTAVTVTVRGISGGIDIVEEKTLNGGTAVATTASFTYLTAITKETSAGTVTATSNSGAVTNITLPARENFKEYWEVRLNLIPDAAYSIYGGYYRKPWELYYDSDISIIPEIHEETLLARATKILLFNQGDAKFQNWEAKANEELLALMDANDWVSESKDARYEYRE
jgi:hypothetical protein